jgi:hypothetical protein
LLKQPIASHCSDDELAQALDALGLITGKEFVAGDAARQREILTARLRANRM